MITAPIRYERLLDFCFACGIIGRSFRDCVNENVRREALQNSSPKYGAWLRASPPEKFVGRKPNGGPSGVHAGEVNSNRSIGHSLNRDGDLFEITEDDQRGQITGSTDRNEGNVIGGALKVGPDVFIATLKAGDIGDSNMHTLERVISGGNSEMGIDPVTYKTEVGGVRCNKDGKLKQKVLDCSVTEECGSYLVFESLALTKYEIGLKNINKGKKESTPSYESNLNGSESTGNNIPLVSKDKLNFSHTTSEGHGDKRKGSEDLETGRREKRMKVETSLIQNESTELGSQVRWEP
ncbi:hypothetical protein EZV62_023630 [Acer yangbiense]|uniref:Zinc knuckle CX2CX4HX4C domain-containing protein n=1 Tax=Acer yangbiense TaxID=1000413 RepID=A0A5C7H4G1_9ROSI|nr:hypothetical protein EZV62_023630 [Acer yangbiense]